MIYKDIKIKMPTWVEYILNTLNEFGYESYIVGGSIRNSLLNIPVKDWDITTNALPEDIIDIFTSLGYKIIPTGLKHGTVTIIIGTENFEVTTFRKDGNYSNNRYPDSVEFIIDSTPLQIENLAAGVSVSSIYEEALAVQPVIRKAELDIKAANKRLNQLYGALSPSLSVGYQISSGYNQSAGYKVSDTEWVFYPDYTYGEQIKDFLNQRVYFNLTVPIFQKYNRITRIGKGKINLLDAKFAKEQVEKGLLKKVEQAHADSKASWDKYLASKESVAAFTEVFEETRKKFELGMVSAIDFGLAQSNLVKAEGDLLHAKYSYVLRTKILDFYRGVPISI